MRVIVVSKQEAGQRLDRYLAKYMSKAAKSFFYKMLRKKNITLNGKKAAGMEKVQEGDEIKLFLSDETIDKFRGIEQPVNAPAINKTDANKTAVNKQEQPLAIVYEDDEVLVVNKASGMLSQKAKKEDRSLVEYITDYLMTRQQQQDSVFRPGICNRLDRNTTGLIVAGKTVESLQYLNRLFKERELHKYYLCIVKGCIAQKETIDGYLRKEEKSNKATIQKAKKEGGVRILTAYEPLEYGRYRKEEYTLLKVDLITGKSHQIRAHLQSIGHPLIGDHKYGNRKDASFYQKEFGLQHQLLHAWKLCLGDAAYLPDRLHGKEWTAPLPEQFQTILKKMGMKVRN